MITGLTVTKSADKLVWGEGNLTYKTEISNQTETAYTSPVITDILKPDLIKLVNDTIKIDGTPIETSEYTYDDNTGKLTINLPTINAKEKKTITFKVGKKKVTQRNFYSSILHIIFELYSFPLIISPFIKSKIPSSSLNVISVVLVFPSFDSPP